MRTWEKIFSDKGIDFSGIENTFFLVGLLSEFMNRFQAKGDTFFEEISWRQCFVLICLNIIKHPPTINELAEFMGSSHQNIMQLLVRLEKTGYVSLIPDSEDKRKKRVIMTKKAMDFQIKYDKPSDEYMKQLFKGIDMNDLEVTIETILKLDDNLKNM